LASSDRTNRAREKETDEQRDRQRLDKWLWFARVVRTRSAAAKLVCAGHVRVNSRRIDSPAKPVAPGDVLTVALEHQVRVLKIVATGLRRGPYAQARHLFEDLSAAPRQGSQSPPAGGVGEAPREPPPDPDDFA
jgi:ribosome-associated heat shock protein Hsp15